MPAEVEGDAFDDFIVEGSINRLVRVSQRFCEIAGVGNVTATTKKMTGTLAPMFRSCAGTGLEPAASNELALTR